MVLHFFLDNSHQILQVVRPLSSRLLTNQLVMPRLVVPRLVTPRQPLSPQTRQHQVS